MEALPKSLPFFRFFSVLMGVTIYDLAREAGVGIGTVSRCLNNHPSVSDETRARVLSVAKRLNYLPHAHARRLASRRTNTCAAIIPYFTNYFFVEVLQGIQEKASDLEFDIIVYGVNHPSQAEEYLRRSLQRGHVDGVLFFSMRLPESYAARFKQMSLPVVLVDAFHPDFDSFCVKNREGALKATRHLLSLGHHDIAMINGSLDTIPGRERLAGFRQALSEFGLPYAPESLFVSGLSRQDGFTRESGHESMNRILKARSGGAAVSALFVASDIQALGALEVAHEQGVRVPEDIAIVGFDDIELARLAGLTTMRQPMHEMGRLALERLIARTQDPYMPVTRHEFTPDLVVRQTSGLPLSGNGDGAGRPANLVAGESC